MEKRDYQPSLLWAKTEDWYKTNMEPPPGSPWGPYDLILYVYRTDATGAYRMMGPKMYWQEEPMTGDYQLNIDQDDMLKHASELGEVVMWDRRLRKTVVIGKTFEEAIKKIG